MAEGNRSRVPVWKRERFQPKLLSKEGAWRNPRLSYVLVAISFLCWVYFQWHLPPAIWAISLVTIVVAFMGLRGEMRDGEKSLWFLLVLLYAGLMIRADSNDRRKADSNLTGSFQKLSADAKNNLDALLKDSGQQFAALLQNQNQQFQTTLNNQKTEFSETLESLHRQGHEQEAIKSTGEEARLNTQEITLELQAMRAESSRQTPTPSASTPPQKPLPPLEPQAIRELKVQALQLANNIDNWIALESKNAPRLSGPIPQTAEETKNLESYMNQLNKEWNDKFNGPANSMVRELQIQGLLISCNGGYLFDSPSKTLRYRGICASAIQRAALNLHQ
jgi:hypothetical protein